MKKFIVIDTWNGDGYSSDNGTQIKIFDTQAAAKRYAESMALQEIEHQETNKGLTYYSDDNSWSACFTIGPDDNPDHGTYQVHELPKNAYAVMILTNVNEVEILTEDKFKDEVEYLSSEFHEHETFEDYEDTFCKEENGDMFVSCFGCQDYDYQFRLIKNI